MIYCEVCDKLIDTDFDAEHFDDCKHLDTTERLDSEICRDCGLEV